MKLTREYVQEMEEYEEEIRKGGSGSGNYGHQGRPGEIGGSGEGGGNKESGKSAHATGSGWTDGGHNTLTEDKYYTVNKPFKVMARTGSEPTNSYYGNSQIYQSKYAELTLNKGDQVHYYSASHMYVAYKGDKIYQIKSKSSVDSEKSRGPFEHSYGGYQHSSPIPSAAHVKETAEGSRAKWDYNKLVGKS